MIGDGFKSMGTMKTMFKTILAFAAAAIAFASCVKEEQAPVSETKTVQFVAKSIETKTAFGTPEGTTYPTLWTGNEQAVKLSLNFASPKDAPVEASQDSKTARFKAEIEDDQSGSYIFYALSPASSYNSFNGTDKYISATIPNSQTPLEDSVDEAAQILYAVSDELAKFPNTVDLQFKHFTAYGKLSFGNLELGDANVTSIAISSTDVKLAGRWNYVVADGKFTENSGSPEVTLITDKIDNLWFACAPVGSMNGKTLKFTVNTDKGPLSKEVTLSGDKYNFTAGRIANMQVNMAGITFAESKVYDLVKDANDLTVDSKILIVAKESDFALSTTQNGNNRAHAAVTKGDDRIENPGDAVQIITLEEGTTSGTLAFNVGDGYLHAASSSNNYLRTEGALSANSSWNVSIAADGTATIVAQGTNTRNTMQYNKTNSIFSCYASASQTAVVIYKLQGSGTVKENYLEVSTNAIAVTADVSAASFTVNSDLVWTASSEDANVTTDGNTVNVSFAANEETVEKTYTVTVSADGVESQVVTITQEAYVDPSIVEKKTIAEFKALEDGDTVYELEGRISQIVTAYSSQYNNISFYIVDETTGDEIQIYRMSCEGVTEPATSITVGDRITVRGAKGSYGGQSQMAQGGTYVSHEDGASTPKIVCANNTVTITADAGAAIYYTTDGQIPTTSSTPYNAEFPITETKTVKAIAVVDGLLQSLVASVECEYVNPDAPQPISETLNIYGTTGVLGTNVISWTGEYFTCTNEKASSSTAIRNSDSDHYRVYAKSVLTFTALEDKAFTKVVVTCTSSSYANVLSGSLTSTGATASVSGSVVTITCSTPLSEITFTATAQTRIKTVVATLN